MKIRVVDKGDLEGILDIYYPIVEKTHVSFEYVPPTPDEFWQRIEKVLKTHPWLVLMKEEKVIGYAYATQVRGREAYSWSAELSVYISDEFQGYGLGRSLYEALMEVLEFQGVQNFYGVISLPNEESELFHQKLGFEKLAVFDKIGFKNGEWRGIAWYYIRKGTEEKPPDLLLFDSIASTSGFINLLSEINQKLLKKTTI